MSVNVTMIGGGSSSFVPPLLRRFIESEVLGDARLTLMDVDADRLETMVKLAGKLVEAEGSALEVTGTLDQRESLRDADFVIAAISVGGMDAWADDIEIPARYGIVMHVADSVGPGGIFRTLRNAPVLESVARDVAEVAPEARIFNYTNPAPVEAMAMLTVADAQVISLCSCTQHPASAEWLASQAGVEPDQIEMPPLVAGINHCAGIKELRLPQRARRPRPGAPAGHRADRALRARYLRAAPLLLGALGRVLPPDAADARALRRPGTGDADAVRDHGPRHGEGDGAGHRARTPRRGLDRARRRRGRGSRTSPRATRRKASR